MTKDMVNTPINVTEVFDALEKWINRRPGLDWRNYGNDANGRSAYRSELRSIAKDKHRAVKALEEARGLDPHKPDLLKDSFRAFSGRLEWVPDLNKCYMCGCALREEERTWGRHSAYGTANRPVCSQACAVADHKDAKDTHHLSYTTGQYFPTEYRKAAATVLETYIASWRQAVTAEKPVTFTYQTMEDVKAANRQIGHHYFDRSTMKFFDCKIESGLIDGKYFITSERFNDNTPRKYTVRRADPDGTIATVGAFQQYLTRDSARIAIRTANTVTAD